LAANRHRTRILRVDWRMSEVHHIHSWEQVPPKVKVSIEQTAKGEPKVSVEISGDDEVSVKDRALKTYKECLKELTPGGS